MALQLYKMRFREAHFGTGYLNTSSLTFSASQLYSALCLEALKNDCLDEWLAKSQQTDFLLSNAFPYTDKPFLPLPLKRKEKRLSLEHLTAENRTKKGLANLQFIPVDKLEAFLNPERRTSDLVKELLTTQEGLSKKSVIMKKGIDPYEVGVTEYDCSLYVLASQSDLFDQLMTALQYSGLGGKRSGGYGQFKLTIGDISVELQSRLDVRSDGYQLLLTDSIPTEDELIEDLVSGNGAYHLVKNSGFTYSPTAHEQLRKQDLYKFSAGSVFKQRYTGGIVDVRPDGFPHPVYNFARGLFVGLGEYK
ncbi:type III-A CRISPR-associated RAMP protein Csm4 [Limosilactobacillus fermentum]|uniref:type III-A CRISPR-associated RAMP protein Csm4 n=1 Tax=Limosilactobacillus fermentum TaxID=1613 RepID=UPI000F5EAF84|nr:type III-A CRISPR-associated RAMP protein Csm4 [Limosilactobacillus fermentum]AZI18545.1 type III-A CRISPR-associated RAMP protein Csm4 [Limosilactobacillus fermentum]